MDNQFKNDIKIELDNIERLIKEMHNLIERFRENQDFVIVRAAGSIIHDFYCAIEKIFERIAINMDENLPEGQDWHVKLLLQMVEPQRNRNAIINQELLEELKQYLRFRHLFRNIYGFELKWEKIEPLCVGLDSIFNKFKACLMNKI